MPASTQQHILQLSARTIGRNHTASVRFARQPLAITTAFATLPLDPPALARGYSDTAALWWRYHDPDVYQHYLDQTPDKASLLEAFEHSRIASLGAHRWPGMRTNLLPRFITENTSITTEMLPALLFQQAIGNTQQLPAVMTQLLADLLSQLQNQSAFTSRVQQYLASLHSTQQNTTAIPVENTDTPDDATPSPSQPETDDDPTSTPSENNPASTETFAPSALSPTTATTIVRTPDSSGDAAAPDQRLTDYKVYTTRFDRVVPAASLATPAELQRLREQLDQMLVHEQQTIRALAHRLQRKLQARQQRYWQYDCESGILDSRRLAGFIANPRQRTIFKQETDSRFRATTLTILVDNSGSMRGRPIAMAAQTADMIARALEQCRIPVEVLGFTTDTWKGGAVWQDWQHAGKPATPGRLNALRHIIYKPAESPWRRNRNHFGLMLKDGLLKENIDGEALLWAAGRLLRRPEPRKLLLVISDGAPVDDATLSVNGSDYLEQHLRTVIDRLEHLPALELSAIGIGHDVGRYYQRNMTIASADTLGKTLVTHLLSLF